MAHIAQKSLFSWENIESSSDLDRLRWVLAVIPDEVLMRMLEKYRANGCDKYPVRAVWNSILAGVVYEHKSVASLRRELSRNGELRKLCGFEPSMGAAAVPSDDAYTNFLGNLFKFEDEIEKMFDQLVEELRFYLPELGKHLAVDSKAIDSAGKPTSEDPDGRRDTDADWGSKTYKGIGKDGKAWEKTKSWFGYKLHLLIDAEYELPLYYEVTRASVSDMHYLTPLVKKLEEKHPEIAEGAEYLAADKGYDSNDNNRDVYENHGIKPIIDIRAMWKGDKTQPLYPKRADNIVYDEKGTVFCVAQSRNDARETEMRNMAFAGFEKSRGTLKYRCPAAAYGFECPEFKNCGMSDYGRIVRVPIKNDMRRFASVPRDSYKWKRLYNGRTSVERVNSRLDVSFGFENHYIRGIKKMRVRTGLALIVMLAMALGHIKAGEPKKMRSLVQPFAHPEARAA